MLAVQPQQRVKRIGAVPDARWPLTDEESVVQTIPDMSWTWIVESNGLRGAFWARTAGRRFRKRRREEPETDQCGQQPHSSPAAECIVTDAEHVSRIINIP